MRPSFFVPVLLAFASACVVPSLDDDDATADDDSTGGDDDDSTGDDDDSTGDDDDSVGDDDVIGDDDDSTGDDDVPPPPPPGCEPSDVIDPTCVVLPLRTWDLGGTGVVNCGEGVWTFTEASALDAFITDCGVPGGGEPLPALDILWGEENLVLVVAGASGCSMMSGVNWAAQCGAEVQVSTYMVGCGMCQMYGISAHGIAVPSAKNVVATQCVPEGAECPDEPVDG